MPVLESYARFLRRFGFKNAVWFGDYCRFREVEEVTRAVVRRSINSLLDVGCAGTLFPHYVSRLLPQARVVGVDSGDNLEFHPAEMTRFAEKVLRGNRVRLFPADGRRLSFRDGTFDAVTAISVVEHIRGDGDTGVLREMKRVVRPGGLIAFSVPMAAHAMEQETSPTCPYFIRSYDERTLLERLIRPIAPATTAIRYFAERGIPYSRFYVALRQTHARWCHKGAAWKPLRYASWAMLALTPWASRVFLRVWDPAPPHPTQPIPGGAIVIMRK